LGFTGSDQPPDDFRDLRDDGVSEGALCVHPIGNPMNASSQRGFNGPGKGAPFPKAVAKPSPLVGEQPLRL
jgi:hypothetical protein